MTIMANDAATARELATHAADIRHLQEDMHEIRESTDSIKKDMAEVRRILAEAKGGWRMLLMTGGSGGALGALVTHWAEKLIK
jgi:hypothetical protein